MTSWSGHLPSDPIERTILNASEGIEGEDGRVVGAALFRPGSPTSVTFGGESHASGPKAVLEDAREAARQARLAQLRRSQLASGHTHSDGSDSDDGDTLRRIRQARLGELRAAAAARRTYGCVTELSQDDFVAAVEEEPPETFVVVHIHEPHLPACAALGLCMQRLAARYDLVKFVSIRASEAQARLSTDVLPALAAYRGGEYLESELNVGASAAEALEALASLGVRLASSPSALDPRRAVASRGGASEEESEEGEDESEDESEGAADGWRAPVSRTLE